ncbi:MAG: 50S ribosome-binding GTPase [Candidatus Omnitrophica bacterium]|nr:50S ribosome-binding GTPase [Candidatus Omnitrophota bacterium]
MIIDKVTIYLRSGKGGEGSLASTKMSSRKMIDSGGDGGKGGNVILKVSLHLYDLSKFKGNKKFIASSGDSGRSRKQSGRDGKDLIVNVPSGTRVLENGKVIADLIGEGSEFLACRGGRGGRGNSKHAPIPAEGSQEKEVNLDYRIPNDVAVLGLGNSGKTSLFNALTGQSRKVAEYAFTTTSCFWANSDCGFERFVILDTPPFKKSKDFQRLAENVFLRHIFRSKILLLLKDETSKQDDFLSLEKEIAGFDESLLKTKKIFYLLTKVDTIDNKKTRKEVLKISINNSEAIEKLKKKIVKGLKKTEL